MIADDQSGRERGAREAREKTSFPENDFRGFLFLSFFGFDAIIYEFFAACFNEIVRRVFYVLSAE